MEGPFLYEPKWDGFRAIVSHGALLAALPKGCVLDGEIAIATPRGLWFRCFLPSYSPRSSEAIGRLIPVR